MYSIISSLATPIIAINVARNYFAWNSLDSQIGKDGQAKLDYYQKQVMSNVKIAASIFCTGTFAVGMHAMKFQKPTPLIMSAMAYRLVAVALISFATGYSGTAVSLWCFRQTMANQP
ncbi:MAG: hypothetical protein KBA81_04270 [Rhabdochlamydiaceae bacterium]|jgi:hypothetical protein|nr:hypothetical protein [Rhabdochlamydiaceae bacterium]